MPYFYIIEYIPEQKYYVGIRLVNDDTTELLQPTGYQTSSNHIHELIKLYGLEAFKVRKLKSFETRAEVIDYETRFLNRVNAQSNERFLNKHNNRMVRLYEAGRETCLLKYGYEFPLQSPGIREKSKNTIMKRYGVSNPAHVNRDKVKSTMLDRYGVENYFQTREQLKIYTEKTGYNCPMSNPEVKDRVIKSRNDKANRDEVHLIKRYVLAFDIHLNRGWYQFSDEKIKSLLDNIIDEYGDIDELERREIEIKNTPIHRPGNKITTKKKAGRDKIKEIKDFFMGIGFDQVPFGRGWHMKSDEEIEKMFKEYKEKTKCYLKNN